MLCMGTQIKIETSVAGGGGLSMPCQIRVASTAFCARLLPVQRLGHLQNQYATPASCQAATLQATSEWRHGNHASPEAQ